MAGAAGLTLFHAGPDLQGTSQAMSDSAASHALHQATDPIILHRPPSSPAAISSLVDSGVECLQRHLLDHAQTQVSPLSRCINARIRGGGGAHLETHMTSGLWSGYQRLWDNNNVELELLSPPVRTSQLQIYISPVPDPQALAVNTLSIPREGLKVFPSPVFVPRVLQKIRDTRNLVLILVAPWWPVRSWFVELRNPRPGI